MRLSKGEKIALIIGFGLWLCVSISVWRDKPVDSTNIIVLKRHFSAIFANRPSRGSLNYDLFTTYDNTSYKIGANFTDCFDYESFKNDVKVNDPIEINIKKEHSLIESSSINL